MDGLIIIDKEQGYTSRDIVNIVSKKLNTKKIGHTGTLDPLATGVLVLAVGKALKIAELVTSYDKEYIATVIIGYETDTLDVTGNKTNEKIIDVTEESVIKVLNSFIGNYLQEVPKYSAIKVNGKKLYEYARANIDVKLPVKDVLIYELNLLNKPTKVGKYYEFKIKCKVSKGTYIRSLIRDIGYKLNSYGTMKELRRTVQGNFKITSANTLEDIKNNKYTLIPISNCLNYPRIVVEDSLAFKVKNGMILNKFFNSNEALIYDKSNNLIALYKTCEEDSTKVKVWKMF